MVRAAHVRPAIFSRYFLLAHYLYRHPVILVKIFVRLDLFLSVAHKSRVENINDGQTFPRKSTWPVTGSC